MKKFLFTCLIVGILGVSTSNAAHEGTVFDPMVLSQIGPFDEAGIIPFGSWSQAWGYQGQPPVAPEEGIAEEEEMLVEEEEAMSDEEYRNAQFRVMQIPDLVDCSTPATMSESLERIAQLYSSPETLLNTKRALRAFTSSVASLVPGETSYAGLTEEEDDTEMIVKANILAMRMIGQEITKAGIDK